MRKLAATIGFLLVLSSPLTRAEAINLDEPGKLPPDRIEMQDKTKEDECDCCQKCKAAQRPIVPKEEAGAPLKDGCEDCCNRCGKALPSVPEDTPPDIMEKPKP